MRILRETFLPPRTQYSHEERKTTHGIGGQGSYNDRRWTWMLCEWLRSKEMDVGGQAEACVTDEEEQAVRKDRVPERETEELAHRPWGRTQKIQQVEGADSQAVTRPVLLKLKGAQVVECGFWSRWIESYQSFNPGSHKVWCLLSKDQFGLYVENESWDQE